MKKQKIILVLQGVGFMLFVLFGDFILDEVFPSDIDVNDPKIKNAQSLLKVIIKYTLFVFTFIILIVPIVYFFVEAKRDLIKTIKINWINIIGSVLCFFGYYFIDIWMESPLTGYFITSAILLLGIIAFVMKWKKLSINEKKIVNNPNTNSKAH